MSDLGAWIGLVRFQKFGPKGIARLAIRFSDLRDVFTATATDLLETGIKPNVANRFLQERDHIDCERELALLHAHDVQAITIHDERYPQALKEIYDPPAVLFVKGTLADSTRRHIAVVGSRKATGYAKRVIEDVIKPLSSEVVIVSGLAYGVDSMAHLAAVESGGLTMAVLGSGLDHDNIYPSPNRTLASRILASGGALLSEFPIGTPPLQHHFPMRNRIIAGMCEATVVVEAAEKSGSLITARLALEHNRDVYAVPGPIHAVMSHGPHALIKDGAIPLTRLEDISQPSAEAKTTSTYDPANENEQTIYDLLSAVPMHVDEIVHSSNLAAPIVLQTLSLMEMKGGVTDQGGRHFVRTA